MYIQIPSRFEIHENMLLGHGDCLDLMKDIPEFPHYVIFSDGRVYNKRNGRFKKSCLDKKGYSRIRLVDGSRGATKKIHRLVAEAFLCNYNNSLQINHKNCNKSDNRICNLEMVTQSQNTKHAWANGRMKLTKRDEYGKFTKGE
jgi:hypothetical protein